MVHDACSYFLFFFNDTATTEIYTLSLHDALPILGVCVDGHDRGIVGEQVFAAECFHEPLLDFVFGGSTVTGAPADFLKGGNDDRIDAVARGKVRLDLFCAPGGFELRNQIGGAHNILTQATQ